MRRIVFVLAAASAATMLTAANAAAQGRGSGNAKNRAEAAAKSPAFCRSGAGHPVQGRAWCIDKGFALGDQDWRRVELGRVILGPGRGEDRVDRGGLIDILGDIVFGRLEQQRSGLGTDSPLSGRWLTPPDGPRVLQVWAGDLPLGELVDNDRNGSIDLVVMRFGR